MVYTWRASKVMAASNSSDGGWYEYDLTAASLPGDVDFRSLGSGSLTSVSQNSTNTFSRIAP